MVMDIAVRLDICPSSDKGVRRKHGRHDHRYSVGNAFLPTEIVAPSTVGSADGGRWLRSNRGDMHPSRHPSPLSYLIANSINIPYG